MENQTTSADVSAGDKEKEKDFRKPGSDPFTHFHFTRDRSLPTMNTLIFLGGLGTGAVGTTIAFLFVIHALMRQRKGGEEETRRANAESIAALRERNEIGRGLVSALESVIDKTKGTFRMVDVERGNVYKTHLGEKLSGGRQ